MKIAAILLVCFTYLTNLTPSEAGVIDQVTVITAMNTNRAKYGAKPVLWSASLVPGVTQYARMCKLAHSDARARYGETLHAVGKPNVGIAEAINSWMAEASKYNYHAPGFSAATGDFTQIVWKSTTQVVCVQAQCGACTIFSQPATFTVCRYTPPGNFPGQFPQNVGRPVI
ncbi:CAP domain-containing protein [Linnemannia elongata]|nr:CAP domain-containing protein [Linnemannia elongata]